MTLSGTPAFTRCESTIAYDWGIGGPGNGLGVDQFSVRWSGSFNFAAGDYSFTAQTDDGHRVWVDGTLLLDHWIDQGATAYSATRSLAGGVHQLKVEFYENAGGATAHFGWNATGTVNQPPTATITAPLGTLQYKVGDVISYAGSGNDPETGAITATSLAWQIIIHHCPGGACHTHSFLTATGAGGSFTVPDHGDDSYFELILTATDPAGLTGTASVSIHPQTVQLTLATVPSGLQVGYDGDPLAAAPLVKTTIAGSSHTINAPSPQGNQTFSSWSDRGAAQHNITLGTTNATYTATFATTTGVTATATTLPNATATRTPTVTPTTTAGACTTGQYQAQYFNNMTLSGTPTFTQCEPSINYDWGLGGPGNGLGVDQFSIRWTGQFTLAAGSYTFTAQTDDGHRVWVDNALLLDHWFDQGATLYQATVTLTAGAHTIKMEYYENGGGATASLAWVLTAGAPTLTATGTATATRTPTVAAGAPTVTPTATASPTVTATPTAGVDTTPPTLSAIQATGISQTTATITWTTNEPATSQVEYGRNPNYGAATPVDTTLVTSHSQPLTGLTRNTVYHYRVLSRDAAGNLTRSGDSTFKTSN
jgi:hypothetical protein